MKSFRSVLWNNLRKTSFSPTTYTRIEALCRSLDGHGLEPRIVDAGDDRIVLDWKFTEEHLSVTSTKEGIVWFYNAKRGEMHGDASFKPCLSEKFMQCYRNLSENHPIA